MTTALVIVVAVGALACPLHMLWAIARRRRPSCLLLGDRCRAALSERQRQLAARVETVAAAGHEDRSATSALRA